MIKKIVKIIIVTFLIVAVICCCYKYLMFGSIFAEKVSPDEKWEIMLVNEKNYVGKDYIPKLVELSNGEKIDSRVYPHLQEMFNAARARGFNLVVRSGYRTFKEQKKLWNEEKETSLNDTEKSVQRPGMSEHQTGLAVDINAIGNTNETGLYKWLNDNAYKFGFILRYPQDKTEVTRITYEPWHFRYVGIDVAKIIKKENLCLEEYLEKYK